MNAICKCRENGEMSRWNRVTLVTFLVLTWISVWLTPVHARVLFLVHADGNTADADFARGVSTARPVPTNDYAVVGTRDGGRFGRALDITRSSANCTYAAAGNFDPRRGTAELWFRVDKHAKGQYHPLFGWYRLPRKPGDKKRDSGFEVYLHDSVMVLGLYTPEYKGHTQRVPMKVGQWHHLEVNWNCLEGAGRSEYSVFLDGKRVIRVIDGGALTPAPGGSDKLAGMIHVGVWDYGWGICLFGMVDELRISDQVEHPGDFQPPGKPYHSPGTLLYARETHQVVGRRLKQLAAETRALGAFSGAEGDGAAAMVIREGRGTVEKVSRVLATMTPTLKSKGADVKRLGTTVDAAVAAVSRARVAVHRVTAVATAMAAKEDKRSLLFKDLNDGLVGDAIVLNGRQLFIDQHVIEDIQGAKRVLNQPIKHPRNPLLVADKPWEKTMLNRGSVIYDKQAKLFKMWYSVYTTDLADQLLCYATSVDGLKWDKPAVNPADGSNVIPNFKAANPPSVFKDLHETDPARRYKMLYGAGTSKKYTTNAAYSPDGLKWTPEPANPVIPHSDTLNSCFWDAGRKRYVAFVRFGPPNIRMVSRVESPDFVHWSPKVTVIGRRPVDMPFDTKLYGMRVLPYHGTFLGFLSAYHGETIKPIPEDKLWMDRTNVQLTFSRNGLTWEPVGQSGTIPGGDARTGKRDWKRIAEQATFLPYGESRETDWDWGQVYPFDPPLVVDDQVWLYYQGLKGRHWFKYHKDSLESGFGLATIRRDGFVSVDAPGAGMLQTRRFIAIGDTLVINANAGEGEIRVEAVDALGRVVKGFSRDDCDPIRGDKVRHVVSWKKDANCHSLQARPIKLRFHLKRAKLYSFEFQIRRNNFVPLSYSQK
ncbi:hypothetical protein OAJ60_00585 [Planctomycetaceae bacterium]|nr:hypothetical protein [Planctomycetaceae bacterium]